MQIEICDIMGSVSKECTLECVWLFTKPTCFWKKIPIFQFSNPNFPSTLHDKLPAPNDEGKFDILRENLNTLHSARQAFIAVESDEHNML